MKVKLRLFYKVFLLIPLFGLGSLIAGGIFPAIHIFASPLRAKTLKDTIKKYWLKGFAGILNLHVVQEGRMPGGGTLLVSNHISWLDIIVLGQCVSGCFVAKSDIEGWPVIGYLAKKADTIFIRRGDKKQILATAETMAWQFRQNGNIMAFPEGTTTAGDEVLDFHGSLFQPALLTKSAIQPVAVRYVEAAAQVAPFVGDDRFIPHLLTMLALERIEAEICFLPTMEVTGKKRSSISAEARTHIVEKLFVDGGRLAGSERSAGMLRRG